MNTDNSGDKKSQYMERPLRSLNALRCFQMAAQLENFSKAAEALCLTHGAVSRAVRSLEDDLGSVLFERRNQRVYLSAAGEKLLAATERAFALIDDATREIRKPAQENLMRVSCEPTLLMRWLIPRMPAFMASHPEIPVQLIAGGGAFSFSQGIDFAIRRNDFPWAAGMHAHWLFDEEISPVCHPSRVADWTLAGADGLQLKADAPRLQSATRPSAWRTWAEQSGMSAAQGDEQVFEHFYFSLQAASAGLGLAIGPRQLVRDDLANGLLAAPLGFIADGSSYYLLTPEPIGEKGAAAQLLTWLRQAAKN
ncbi:MAG: LysR family transcriptional regulator [Pseudomonas sp.]|uniref:LysR family transcriptional regulator n=1 Tax=Pseudomonas sp. TaxID=306 RepID=UPI0027354EE5|nr:LysR family transcriptional regulator [Pseudomonas sp.]MDP3848034.1 LysR family transcriptional regulator [Pseudomonas sp.]